MGLSPSDTLGLALTITADASQAEATINQFAGQAKSATQALAAQQTQYAAEVDRGILSARESSRLLAEELGIHLPRAVTGAVAEILPSIASMGTAFLGVFAVKMVIDFVGELKKMVDEFNGAAEAAKALKEIGKENLDLIKKNAEASIAYAHAELARVNAAIPAMEAEVELQKRHNEGLDYSLYALSQFAALYHWVTRGTKELHQAESALQILLKQRDDLLKILAKDEDTLHKKALENAQKHAEALARQNEERNRAQQAMLRLSLSLQDKWKEWNEEELKSLGVIPKHTLAIDDLTQAINQSGRAALAAWKGFDALGSGVHKLSEEERLALPLAQSLTDNIHKQLQRTQALRQELTGYALPAMKRIEMQYYSQINAAQNAIAVLKLEAEQQKTTRAQMEEAELAYAQIVQNAGAIRTAALQKEALAQGEALASMLGLEKEFVIAEATFMIPKDIAQAAERFAVGDFWGGMQFTLAAAQWGVSAGKAVAALIGGGGPKVSANIPGQTGGAASTRSPMSSTAGTSEAQPTKVIRIEVSDNALLNGRMVRDLIDAINQQVTGNNVVLQATSSQYVQRRS